MAEFQKWHNSKIIKIGKKWRNSEKLKNMAKFSKMAEFRKWQNSKLSKFKIMAEKFKIFQMQASDSSKIKNHRKSQKNFKNYKFPQTILKIRSKFSKNYLLSYNFTHNSKNFT